MFDIKIIPISIFIVSLIFTLVCIFMNKYPKKFAYINIRKELTLEEISNYKLIKPFVDFYLIKGSIIRNSLNNFLKNFNSDFTEREIVVLKIFCCIGFIFIYFITSYTNLKTNAENIISNFSYSQSDIRLFNEEYSPQYNKELYDNIVAKAGKETLENMTSEKRLILVKSLLPDILGQENSSEETVLNKAIKFEKTFTSVEVLSFWDWKIIFLIFSFFLPEFTIFLSYYINRTKIEKEIVKLENIFLLLSSVQGFKTKLILQEMEDNTNMFKSQLHECIKNFAQEDKKSLIYLRDSVNNKRFKELINQIISYTFEDDKKAIENLDRSINDRERLMVLSASKDVDRVEILCLVALCPCFILSMIIIFKPLVKSFMDFSNLPL